MAAYTGAHPHTNQMHFSFSWAGAMRRTPFWTGKVGKTDYGPCPRNGGLAPKYNGRTPSAAGARTATATARTTDPSAAV